MSFLNGTELLEKLIFHVLTSKCIRSSDKELVQPEKKFSSPLYTKTSYVGVGRVSLAAFLRENQPSKLRPLTDGMFGYSVTRPMASSDFFFDVIDTCARLDCPIESWHTESGPGVFEGVSSRSTESYLPTKHLLTVQSLLFKALKVCEINEMADRVSLFK